ncbi:MAG: arginine--tRNA ligase, partial [Allosphingosinicella sp.]
MTLYARFAAHLHAALDALEQEGALAAGVDRAAVAVEPPRDLAHDDLATNAAMVLAKRAGANPRALAEAVALGLARIEGVAGAEVAG